MLSGQWTNTREVCDTIPDRLLQIEVWRFVPLGAGQITFGLITCSKFKRHALAHCIRVWAAKQHNVSITPKDEMLQKYITSAGISIVVHFL